LSDLQTLARAHGLVTEIALHDRGDAHAWTRAGRTRDRWAPRLRSALEQTWPAPTEATIDLLAKAGSDEWARHASGATEHAGEAVGKAVPSPSRVLDAVVAGVRHAVQGVVGSLADFRRGAMAVYMSVARDASEDAGQHTLDALGLNRTFRWTGQRDMPRDLFAVRGSRLIQKAYGSHLDELARIVARATDPARPRTQSQIKAEIAERWPALTRRQAERIARTETANVWETANYNTAIANGVNWFDVLIAHGPSIGPPTSQPVCPDCLRVAAGGPYPAQEAPELPVHPNCRCTLVPSVSHDWLPPAEPWAGNEPALPLRPAGALEPS